MIVDTQNILKHSFYLRDNYLLHIFYIFLLIFVCCVGRKYFFKLNHCLPILLFLYVCFGICFVLYFNLKPIADQREILSISEAIINNDFQAFQQGGYMYINPHQNGILLYVYVFNLIFRQNTYLVLQLLNVFFLAGCFGIIAEISKILWPFELYTNLGILSYILFIPIFFYITFIYGTLPGLFLALLAILLLLKYNNCHKITDGIGAVICIGIATVLKSNFMIFGIAMIVFALYQAVQKERRKEWLVFVLGLVIISMGSGKIVNNIMEDIAGVTKSQGSPMISYVAMGLQDNSSAPGWWNGYNWNVYVDNNYDYDLAKEKSKDVIARRIEIMIEDPASGIRFFIKKIASGWNNPTFQSLNILCGREGKYLLWDSIAQTKKGCILHLYMNLYHSAILFGVIIWFIKKRNKCKISELLFPTIVIGGFIFHLIWEMQCSYTIPYFLLIILYGVRGYGMLTNDIITHYKRFCGIKNYVRKGILCIVMFLLTLILVKVISETTVFTKLVGLNEETEIYREIYYEIGSNSQ